MEDPAIIHLERATAFLRDARACSDPKDWDRHLASSVENAVGIVESSKERAKPENKRLIEEEAVRLLPHYRLLKDVRVHNFHRRPLPPRKSAKAKHFLVLGPIELSVGKAGSSVEVTVGDKGLVYTGTGDFKVKDKVGGSGRALQIRNHEILDPDASAWVEPDVAVERFLGPCSDFLAAILKYLEK